MKKNRTFKSSMGCQRLTYHQKTSSKTESTPIFEMGEKQGSDYQVGGMIMPGRSSNFDAYRFGFNGMESDDEVSGEGNSYTTEFRQYDPRLMRWKSIDPLAARAPGWTPYRAFFNNPIIYTDNNGLFEDRKSARKYRKEHDDVSGRIRKNDDGTFSINGKTTSYFKGDDKGYSGDEHKNDGVIEAATGRPSTKIHHESYKFKQHGGRDDNGQIYPQVIGDNHKNLGTQSVHNGKNGDIYVIDVEHQTYWAPHNRDSHWKRTTIVSDDYLEAHRAAWALSDPGCIWCDDAQLSPEESALLGNAILIFGSLRSPNSFMKNTEYTNKVKWQMRSGDYHSFPRIVDLRASYGKVTTITGGDGVTRLKLSIPGIYRGKVGNFVYIKEAGGKINHRLFEPNR